MKKIHISGQYFLNHRLEEGELRRQIGMIAAAGYENIYAHARSGMITPYFSESWWRALTIIEEECAKNQLLFSIWDEDYFPSGVAGDRIVLEHPELRGRKLHFNLREFASREGDGLFRFDDGALLRCFILTPDGKCLDVTHFCGSVRRRWGESILQQSAYSKCGKIDAPHWRNGMNEKCFALDYPDLPQDALVVAVMMQEASGTHNTDLMNRETCRVLLECNHDQYRKRFDGKEKGKWHSVFLDEPSVESFFPWTPNFAAEFTKDHQFDLLPLLAHLAVDIDDRTPVVRRAYRLTVHRLLCENYLRPVAEWAHRNQLLSIGHLSRAEWLYYVAGNWPEELRCYREMDIPCCDPLGGIPAYPDCCANHTALKVVSSAAHIFHKEQAGSDALGVIGDEASLRDIKYHLDYQMALGITFFNLHGLSYSFAGPRKDEVPPSLFYQHPEWPWMKELLDHVRNTCEALSEGEHLCQIGVLYPGASFYCHFNAANVDFQDKLELKTHELAEKLLSNQRDFDFIDEITLGECDQNGLVKLPENWQVIILNHLRYISQKTAQVLTHLSQQGCRLIMFGKPPMIVGDTLEEKLSPFTLEVEQYDDVTDSLLATLPGVECTGNYPRDIFVLRRKLADGKIRTFAFYRGDRDFEGMIDGVAYTIPRHGSMLSDQVSLRTNEVAGEIMDYSQGWTMDFRENLLPLVQWEVCYADENPDWLHFQALPFNMLEREKSPYSESERGLKFECHFLASGSFEKMELQLDAEALTGKYEIFINDQPVGAWRTSEFKKRTDITHLLRHSPGSPLKNTVKIIVYNGMLKEMPHLAGLFQAEYRFAFRSLPVLTGCADRLKLEQLSDWATLGFPAYAGAAIYSKSLHVGEAGEYVLNLGQVEDLAEVEWDGKKLQTLFHPPYRLNLGHLAPGDYQVKLRIASGAGNRDRLAFRPTGLLGPVRLEK